MRLARRRLSRRNACRILAGALAGQAAGGILAQTRTGQGRKMADLNMTVEAVESHVVTQQSVLLRVTLRNTATSARPVPDTGGETPFVYGITGIDPAQRRIEVSVQSMYEALTEGTPQPAEATPDINLGAGYRSQRVDDVLQLLNRPLTPGAYDIAPKWARNGETLESPPARVQVEVPRPAAVSTALSMRDRKRVLAMVQPVGAGRNALLVQALEPGIKTLARFESILTQQGPAGSVAASVETQDAGGMHWVAWLSGSTLRTRLHPSLRVPPAQPELAVDAKDGRLLTPGFTTGNGEGIFVVLANENGKAGLLVYRFHEEGSRLLWHAKEWLNHVPEHLLLRHLDYGNQGGALQFIWAEGSAPTRVMTQTLLLDGGKTVAAPSQLWKSETAIRAWDVAPTGTKQGAQISIVSGPGAGGTYLLSRVRVPVARTESAPDQVTLPAMVEPPLSWATLGLRTGSAAAASDGKRLLVALPGKGQWVVRENVHNAQHVRLTSVDGASVWLEWLDPEFGFRVAKVG